MGKMKIPASSEVFWNRFRIVGPELVSESDPELVPEFGSGFGFGIRISSGIGIGSGIGSGIKIGSDIGIDSDIRIGFVTESVSAAS